MNPVLKMKKVPLWVWGRSDIGKSAIIRTFVAASGGCQHELILRHFPQDDLVSLHLSDIAGVFEVGAIPISPLGD